MKDYNYYEDMINSMDTIDGIWPSYITILTDENDKWRSVKVKITDKTVFIYPFGKGITETDSIITIDRDDIEYYKEDGEIYHEQVISGGGSTSVDVKGAIVGQLIAGPAGMIIGGQRKVNEIKSSMITHDTRKILLSYFINKSMKIRRKIFLGYNILQFLNDNIPEKEFGVVDINRKKKFIDGENEKTSVKDKLKDLNDMLKEGLITQEEFEEKKKKLLDEL